MRHLGLFAAVVLLVPSVWASNSYTIDKDHSTISFTVKHMGISNVKGTFKDFDGKILFDEKTPSKGNAEVNIKASSITTGNDKRDDHLKSPDFFDVSKFPEISFKTTKVIKAGSKYKIEGVLKLHGVEKPVTLTAEFGGAAKDPWGNQKIAFTATGKINRQEFGLTWNKPMEKAGAVLVGNDVNMTLDVEAVQQKDEDKKASNN